MDLGASEAVETWSVRAVPQSGKVDSEEEQRKEDVDKYVWILSWPTEESC